MSHFLSTAKEDSECYCHFTIGTLGKARTFSQGAPGAGHGGLSATACPHVTATATPDGRAPVSS